MNNLKYKILNLIYSAENRTIDKITILNMRLDSPWETETNIEELSKPPFNYIKPIPCSDKYTLTNEGVYAFETAKKFKSHEKLCWIRDLINTVIAIAALVFSIIAIA